MTKITKEQFIREWCADLRSTKYVQGRAKLCQTIGVDEKIYCCLGVAKHITAPRLGIHVTKDYQDNELPGKWFYDLIGEHDPDLEIGGRIKSCCYWNDIVGKNFEEMARAIEDNLCEIPTSS